LHCECSSSITTSKHPPLLLIHGLLGYSFSWRFNLAALAQGRTIYAMDLPGVGFSDRPKGMDCSLRGLAQFLQRFMDAAGVGTVDVLGTSHGGAVAMLLASEAPQRVRRQVLVAPVNPWSEHGRWQARAFSSAWGGLLLRCVWPYVRLRKKDVLARMYGDPSQVLPGTVEGYSAPFAIPGTLDYLRRVMRGWQPDVKELGAVLARIAHIRTLLVWGSRDPVVPLASASELRKQFEYAELEVIEGAGHLPYEEAPEEFNRVVGRFLDGD
jgi:pimeloyl-ACP methyl ester carboxylesterase